MNDGTEAGGVAGKREKFSRRSGKRKSKSYSRRRKRAKTLRNLAWFAGGLAIGLPLLILVLLAVSRY